MDIGFDAGATEVALREAMEGLLASEVFAIAEELESLGEVDRDQDTFQVSTAKEANGFGATVVKDIRAAQWSKFVGLSTNAALTALVRRPAGVIYHDPDLLEIARQGFAEAAAVARAMGIDLPVDIVEAKVKQHQGFPADMYASMYHDLSRGKRLELESLSGLVVRKGRELGVPTPVHEMACACLKPFLDGNAG
jgi:2-dehydropantoate 2-reductase